MRKERLLSLLDEIDSVSVGVLGDFCIDMYWEADLTKSRLSRETPHFPLPVYKERVSLGAAGNVLSNIAALRPKKYYAIGVTGDDWRGMLLRETMQKTDADRSGLVTDPARFTNAFIKPMRHGLSETVYEDPRLDFETYAPLPPECERELLAALIRIAPSLDVLCVCDQFAFGCVTPVVRKRLAELSQSGLNVIVDSRDRIGLFEQVIVKPNDIEVCREFGRPVGAPVEELRELALALSEKNQRPVFVTIGSHGCIAVEHGTATHVPAVPVPPPIDICGAGDTFLSALACALAAHATAAEAAELANLAASLTIRQFHTTGVATHEALLSAING